MPEPLSTDHRRLIEAHRRAGRSVEAALHIHGAGAPGPGTRRRAGGHGGRPILAAPEVLRAATARRRARRALAQPLGVDARQARIRRTRRADRKRAKGRRAGGRVLRLGADAVRGRVACNPRRSHILRGYAGEDRGAAEMRSDAAVLTGEIGSRTGRSILWRNGRTRSTESLAVTEEFTAVALVAAAAIAECAAVALVVRAGVVDACSRAAAGRHGGEDEEKRGTRETQDQRAHATRLSKVRAARNSRISGKALTNWRSLAACR